MTERALADRPWLSPAVTGRINDIAGTAAGKDPKSIIAEVEALTEQSHRIHDLECINLNPATNLMNPRAEAVLAQRLGSRASLGYPGDKYETGLEAIEQIEVVAAELAAELFHARYAEIRVGSGALSNLYVFMATCDPGDTIIAPPATIGGHVTHHQAGAAGRYGVRTIPAPVDAANYTVDVDALRTLARQTRPKLITIGGSLNLWPHPVAELRAIADEVGAYLLFDAAHQSGLFAGGVWANPLDEGAHIMTMSTYKSLGGPAGGLIVGNDAALAERIEAIAYPGLTANFDAAKTAALAITLADWQAAGEGYAQRMIELAASLAEHLAGRGVPVFGAERGYTASHQFGVIAGQWGGGQAAAVLLRQANLLACGIGLPIESIDGDTNGLRIGTPELARIGMQVAHMDQLSDFIARGLFREQGVGAEVTEWRAQFDQVHFTADLPN